MKKIRAGNHENIQKDKENLFKSLKTAYSKMSFWFLLFEQTSRVAAGILVEGSGCILAGMWGSGSGTTSYSENVGAIGITKVGVVLLNSEKSRTQQPRDDSC